MSRTPVRLAAAVALAGTGTALAVSRDTAGPRSDGTAVTPVGYRVTPAGRQTDLGDLPVATALAPDGKHLVVSNAGQGQQSLQVVDTATSTVVQTIAYKAPEAVSAGLVFRPDGTQLYASTGGNNKIRVYDVAADGTLTERPSIPLPTRNPAGVKVNPFPAGLDITPDGTRLVVADQVADAASVVTLATRTVATVPVGHAPFGVAVSRDGRTAWVSDQGDKTLHVLDVSGAAPVVRGTVAVGTHPNVLRLDRSGDRLYVANGDSDDVSVVDTAAGTVARTLSVAPRDDLPVGSNPDGLALARDERTLYVANSGDNAVAVVDLDSGRVRGSIPTAWYPTGVETLGQRLFVANAKGLGAGPNNGPGYPNPESTTPRSPDQYVGSMMVGTLSTVDLPRNAGRLRAYTEQVAHNDGLDGGQGGTGNVVPRLAGQASPIKHVIYVVKENRTFDQVFGDLGKGNGDPSLTLFGDESATNSRALQRQYVTLDNFYADAEVSAQGWNWSVAANSNPYAEKIWPFNYSGRNAPYPSESGDDAIAPGKDPATAYIWDRLAAAGVSFRNYGFYVDGPAAGAMRADDPVLDAHTDRDFIGYTLNCPDSPGTFAPRSPACGGKARYQAWEEEFRRYEANGDLPTVEFVRLPNDHTAGTRPGSPTPKVYVGDNDWALGRMVDAVSHSTYWKHTAIFVTEDDAQNGPDHVDAHRTTSWVISPYSRTGTVDSTFYSTASMLRTIELITGLAPLSRFDAFSTPMSRAFTAKPDLTPYEAQEPPQNWQAVNGVNAPLAARSARQPLAQEDRVDEQSFNEAIWKSVKGAASRMPAPRHSLWGAVPNDQAEQLDDADD